MNQPNTDHNARLREFVTQWAKEFAAETVPMTDEQSELFMKVCTAEARGMIMPPEATAGFAYNVLKLRCQSLDLTYTPVALIFLATLASNPAGLVMYINAIKALGHDADTMGVACCFPSGFLTEERMRVMWDKQKGHAAGIPNCDNILDAMRAEVWS